MVEGSALNKTFTLLPLTFRGRCGRGGKYVRTRSCSWMAVKCHPLNSTQPLQSRTLNNYSYLHWAATKIALSTISHVQGKDLWEPTLTAELLAADRFCSWEMESLVFRCAPTTEFIKRQQTALHRWHWLNSVVNEMKQAEMKARKICGGMEENE